MVSQHLTADRDQGSSRTAILDAATEVFMEAGFSGARVDEISRRAHANKAMIYYHFGSKQNLYQAVLLRLFEGILDEILRLRESNLGPEARLRSLYTGVARHLEERPALPPIILREILAGGKGMDAEASRTLGQILGFVSETLLEGTRSGAFRTVHPLLFHLSMLGPLLLHFAGVSFRDRVLPRQMPGLPVPSHDDMLAHLLEVLGRSLRTSTAQTFAPE